MKQTLRDQMLNLNVQRLISVPVTTDLRMHVLLQLLLLLLFSCWCSLPASDALLRLATICLNIWKPTDIKVRPLQALITQLCAHI